MADIFRKIINLNYFKTGKQSKEFREGKETKSFKTPETQIFVSQKSNLV